MPRNNRIVEIYKGIIIRESNIYSQRFNAVQYKMLILDSERTGLPISQILSLSSKPCEKCVNIDVIAYNQDSQKVSIKRGILYDNGKQRSGVSIIKQAHAKTK
jgi:hypothetical protein